MSDADQEPGESEAGDSVARELLRTVTPYNRGHEDGEMNAIGWGIFLAMIVLLVPLLPLLLVVWGISKVFEAIRDD
jgi:hypothetical protein